jgi:polyisoprenoid-binding protein YceI
MRNILSQLMLIVFTCTVFFVIPVQADETYTFDPNHSYVLFHINHFGFSNPSGKWLFNGTLNLDETKPQNSKVSITIQTAKIDTGIPELDTHLKGKLFFDVEQYPTATFVSNKITVTGKDTAKVAGTLTLHGVSKSVTLEVKLNKTGTNPITEKKSVGFTAKTQIARSDFGISTLLPDVGDEVKIDIEAEAAVASPPPASPTPAKVV